MNQMEDSTAIYTLKTIARTQLGPVPDAMPAGQSLWSELANSFGVEAAHPSSEGELARAALALFSEDPKFSELFGR